jgi:hypothetical protein
LPETEQFRYLSNIPALQYYYKPDYFILELSFKNALEKIARCKHGGT